LYLPSLQADFELLENVEEADDEAVDHREDFEADPVKRDEVCGSCTSSTYCSVL